MPNTPVIDLTNIQDLYSRNNFKALSDYFQVNNQLLGFKHINHEETASGANIKISHGLGYIPKDIILTKVVGTGTITFNYSLFDTNFLDVSFSGPARFRAFVGTYWEDQSGSQESSSEVQEVKATV